MNNNEIYKPLQYVFSLSNIDIIDKYKYERIPYIINMLGRLCKKLKKVIVEGSTTIESISI